MVKTTDLIALLAIGGVGVGVATGVIPLGRGAEEEKERGERNLDRIFERLQFELPPIGGRFDVGGTNLSTIRETITERISDLGISSGGLNLEDLRSRFRDSISNLSVGSFEPQVFVGETGQIDIGLPREGLFGTPLSNYLANVARGEKALREAQLAKAKREITRPTTTQPSFLSVEAFERLQRLSQANLQAELQRPKTGPIDAFVSTAGVGLAEIFRVGPLNLAKGTVGVVTSGAEAFGGIANRVGRFFSRFR